MNPEEVIVPRGYNSPCETVGPYIGPGIAFDGGINHKLPCQLCELFHRFHNTHEFLKSKKIDIPLSEKYRAIFSCGEMSIASIAYGIDMLDAERRYLEMYRRDG